MSIYILTTLGIIASLYFAKDIFMPLVMGAFLFFLLDPMVERLKHRYFPRSIISPILMVLVLGLFSIGAWVAFITTAEISSHFPEYLEKIKKLTGFFINKAEEIAESTTQLTPTATHHNVQKVELVQTVGDITGYVLKCFDAIAGVIGSIFIVPVLTLFFLIERDRIIEKLRSFKVFSLAGAEVANKITQIVQGFFVGNLIAGLVSTCCFMAVFTLLGLENTIVMALGAGFLNLFPIIGALLAMVFPLAQSLLQFNAIMPFVVIVAASLVIHFIVGNIILPKLMGSRVDLNVTAATLAMLFWGWLWGTAGVFLAVPLMALLKVMCGLHPRTKILEIVLSESNTKPPAALIMDSLRAFRMASSRQGLTREKKTDLGPYH